MLERVLEAERVQTNLHAVFAFVLVADDQLLVPVVVWSTLSIHCLVRILEVANVMAASLPLVSLV